MEGEISAYESLAIQYYYLGDLDKCTYYHIRVQKGAWEPPDSYEWKTAIENLENYMKEMKWKINYHMQEDVFEGTENNVKITVTITNKMSWYSKVSSWVDKLP